MMIREAMTRDAKTCAADDSVQNAAKLMKECDCGVIPVADGDRLIGPRLPPRHRLQAGAAAAAAASVPSI